MSRIAVRTVLVAFMLACSLPPQCCEHNKSSSPRMKQMRMRKRAVCMNAIEPPPERARLEARGAS